MDGEKVCTLRMMEELWKRGVKSLMVEGGSKLNWSLILNGLVDELIIIHHPMVVGSLEAPTFVEGSGNTFFGFKIESVEVLDGYLITKWNFDKVMKKP
ncbi:MAG: dihydrofolate reductase family protein [Hydrogenothermaceae bacterium]|nr:dihydrofolate reductase family protein [Hydrogenothermaceae bacterium]